MKSIQDIIEVLVESLLCIIAFVMIIWLLTLFDCLSGKQYEIIITFLGVIATFVVLNNFHQVAEIKKYTKEEIDKINQRQKLIEELVLSSEEYTIASKIVEQNHLSRCKKEVWSISVKSKHTQGDWEESFIVKIKQVFIDDTGEIQWLFTNINDEEPEYLKDRELISISEETLDIKPKTYYLENHIFTSYLKILLRRSNQET